MAITVSNVRVQSVAGTPVIAPGEPVSVTFDVTNGDSGYRITACQAKLLYLHTDTGTINGITLPLYVRVDATGNSADEAMNLAYNATATVTRTMTALPADEGVFHYIDNENLRGVWELTLYCYFTSRYGSSSTYMGTPVEVTVSSAGAILVRYGPTTALACRRCDDDGTLNDEGVYALISGSVGLQDTSGNSLFAASLLVYDNTDPTAPEILTVDDQSVSGFTASLRTGLADSDVLLDALADASETLSSNKEYTVTLYYEDADAFEWSAYPYIVSRAFANIHLAGSGAGVSFGKYCTNTGASAASPNDALFECAYHAEFNAGITVASGGVKGANLYVDTAEVDTGDTWIDGNRVMRAVFSGTLTSIASSREAKVGTLAKLPTAILRLSGSACRTASGKYYSLPYVNSSVSNSSLGAYVDGSTGDVYFVVGSGYSISSSAPIEYLIIVEYAAND